MIHLVTLPTAGTIDVPRAAGLFPTMSSDFALALADLAAAGASVRQPGSAEFGGAASADPRPDERQDLAAPGNILPDTIAQAGDSALPIALIAAPLPTIVANHPAEPRIGPVAARRPIVADGTARVADVTGATAVPTIGDTKGPAISDATPLETAPAKPHEVGEHPIVATSWPAEPPDVIATIVPGAQPAPSSAASASTSPERPSFPVVAVPIDKARESQPHALADAASSAAPAPRERTPPAALGGIAAPVERPDPVEARSQPAPASAPAPDPRIADGSKSDLGPEARAPQPAANAGVAPSALRTPVTTAHAHPTLATSLTQPHATVLADRVAMPVPPSTTEARDVSPTAGSHPVTPLSRTDAAPRAPVPPEAALAQDVAAEAKPTDAPQYHASLRTTPSGSAQFGGKVSTAEAPAAAPEAQAPHPGVGAIELRTPAEPQPAARTFAAALFEATANARPARTEREVVRIAAPEVAAASASAPAPAPVSAPDAMLSTPALDTTRHEWMSVMIDRIETLQAEGGSREAHIRLSPDALGGVDVTIRHDEDGVQVRIAADTPQARALLADAAPRLVELAEARGLKLGHAGIESGTGQQQPRHDARQAETPTRPASAATVPDDHGHAETDTRIA